MRNNNKKFLFLLFHTFYLASPEKHNYFHRYDFFFHLIFI